MNQCWDFFIPLGGLDWCALSEDHPELKSGDNSYGGITSLCLIVKSTATEIDYIDEQDF